MFSLRTLIICIIYAAVLYFGHRIELEVSRRNSPYPGLILPILAVIVAIALSFRNFVIAWEVEFNLFAFLAALSLFVFFAVPAMYFILLYVEGRKEVRARKLARSVRMRQVKTQQRVQSNLQQRYESPLEKQEPIVYMPERRTNKKDRIKSGATSNVSTQKKENNPSSTRRKKANMRKPKR